MHRQRQEANKSGDENEEGKKAKQKAKHRHKHTQTSNKTQRGEKSKWRGRARIIWIRREGDSRPRRPGDRTGRPVHGCLAGSSAFWDVPPPRGVDLEATGAPTGLWWQEWRLIWTESNGGGVRDTLGRRMWTGSDDAVPEGQRDTAGGASLAGTCLGMGLIWSFDNCW